MPNAILSERLLPEVEKQKPTLPVLPWGATEPHGHHAPHGTDTIIARALANRAVELANEAGGRCLLLPEIAFGNNSLWLTQAATISLRPSTMHKILFDIADSLVRQGYNRLAVMPFHGGNNFAGAIDEIMMDLPIFIVQFTPYQSLAPEAASVLETKDDNHGGEFETSLLLHLVPELVDMKRAKDGAVNKLKLQNLLSCPGVRAPWVWDAVCPSTGSGDPRPATAEKGKILFESMAAPLARAFTELSLATPGDLPFVLPPNRPGA